MTYFPYTDVQNTEAYFTSLGLIGGATGMLPLIQANPDIPAFDDFDGADLTITNSVAKSTSGSAVVAWSGWDLSASKEKLLMTTYCHPSLSDWIGIGCHDGTLPTGVLEDSYMGLLYGQATWTALAKYTGTAWGVVGSDATIFQDDVATTGIWGIAMYVDGSSNVQKLFVKSGSAQWIQILSTSDATHSSFQSIVLFNRGDDARYISPIMVWGA